MVTVWSSLGVKTTCLGLGKDQVWVKICNLIFLSDDICSIFTVERMCLSTDWPEETDGNKRHDEWMRRNKPDERERGEEISVYDQTLLIYPNSIISCKELWVVITPSGFLCEHFSRWCFLSWRRSPPSPSLYRRGGNQPDGLWFYAELPAVTRRSASLIHHRNRPAGSVCVCVCVCVCGCGEREHQEWQRSPL